MITLDDFGSVYSVYLTHSADNHVRFFSSSGGFCKSFLCYLLDSSLIDAVILTRTGSPSSPLVPEVIVTSSPEDILTSRTNSVYAPTNPLSVALSDDLKYAIVGLGCHIRELDLRQKKGMLKNIKIKIGLLCQHTPNLEFTDWILRKLDIQKENILQIEYRGNGWPGGFTAHLRNGTKKFLSTDDYWPNDLSNSHRRCTYCAMVCESADVVACDPWNLGLEVTDKEGRTLIFCRNSTIDALVNDACRRGFIRIQQCDKSVLIRSQGSHIMEKKARQNES